MVGIDGVAIVLLGGCYGVTRCYGVARYGVAARWLLCVASLLWCC